MKRKIISVLFALVLVLSFSLVTAVPAVADGPGTTSPTVTFRTSGTGMAEWTAEQPHLGLRSAKLATITTDDNGMVRFEFGPGELTLDELTTLGYWEYVSARENPLDVFIDIWLDFNGDGVADVDDYPSYMQAEPYYTVGAAPLNTWTEIDAMNLMWSTYVGPDDPYCAPTINDFQANASGPCVHGHTMADWNGGVDFGPLSILRIDIRVGYGGTWTNFTGYADDIVINSYTQGFEPLAEVWVDDDFVPATTGWGYDAFANIQDGINAVAEAGTVNVAAGTYPENVTIDKTLTLEGAQAGVNARGRTGPESIINAQGTPIAVLINGADTVATFDGFTVDNYDTIGILAGAFKDTLQGVPLGDDPIAVHILNNIVKPPTVAPPHNNNIQVGAGTTGTVIGNEVSGALLESPDWSGSGIIVASSSDILVSNNYVHNSEGGIQILGYAEYQGRPAAENNLIENNLVEGNECGISVQGNSIGTIIRYNDVLNNDVGIGSMAYDLSWPEHSTPSGTEVHYNNIVDNKDYGVESGVWGSHTGNVLAEEVDATNNWWGDASGPTHASNSGGAGDPVTDNVVFSPWLGDTFDTTPMTFVELVTGTDPSPVELQDEAGNPIATVDISGGDAAQGTIAARSEEQDPEPGETSLAIGTGKTGVVFVDVQVTGYTSGTAHIIVPYPDVDPDDGIVDGTDIDENTLGLYYWDDNADMWRIAGNNTVDTANNIVSGYIPVVALTGTPIGLGGYPADEATVAIDSIPDLSYSGNDTVDLIITTNTAKLGAVTIDLTFNSTVVEVLGGENSQFDSLTVNPVFGTQTARFVASQLGPAGVDATGGAVLAQVRLKAVGNTGSSSPLTLSVVTLKDNDGISIPRVTPTPGTATIGGLGDANSDGAVDVYDCVYIARVIAGIPGFIPNTLVMDVSGDGTVDAWDCTYLARHLAGIPGYELGG